MRLIGVTMVRNEGDIFETFARSNLHHLDGLYVLLHRSQDGTRDIAAALKNEGLNLRVFEDEREGFLQDVMINNLARRAFEESAADFVFPLDGDEILQAADRASLEASLRAIPPRMAGLLRWQTYTCSASDDPTEQCPTRRITQRYDLGPGWDVAIPAKVDAEYCKVVVGRWFHEEPSARIFEGNHAVFCDGRLAMTPCVGVEIAHFPVRSLDQLSQKVVVGWLSCLASGRDPERLGLALHWKGLFERLRDNGALSWEDAARFAASYVPQERRMLPLIAVPIADYVGPLLHSALHRNRNFTRALMDTAEQLARAGSPK